MPNNDQLKNFAYTRKKKKVYCCAYHKSTHTRSGPLHYAPKKRFDFEIITVIG